MEPGKSSERGLATRSQPTTNIAASTDKVDTGVVLPATVAGEPAVNQVPASNVTVSATDTSFSFQAVTKSANSLGATAEKLRELLGELRTFVEGGSISTKTGSIDSHMRGTIDSATVQLRGVVDHAAKRLAQLLLLAFVLVIVYQVGVIRFLRSQGLLSCCLLTNAVWHAEEWRWSDLCGHGRTGIRSWRRCLEPIPVGPVAQVSNLCCTG